MLSQPKTFHHPLLPWIPATSTPQEVGKDMGEGRGRVVLSHFYAGEDACGLVSTDQGHPERKIHFK